jgi:PKD repeat protein
VAVINAPPSAAVGDVITFDGSGSTSTSPIVSYQWDLGDGTVLEGAVVDYTYAAPGPYQVSLTVVDGDGLSGETTMPITIVAEIEAAPLPATTEP